MATGTAQLLFGAAHRQDGGMFPQVSLWYVEGRTPWWQVLGGRDDGLRWTPRSPDRAVLDALVMLLALTNPTSEPVPATLAEMAPGIDWRSGHVDLTTWRRYDTDRLDALVLSEASGGWSHGKLVLSLFAGTTITEQQLEPLRHLRWDVDVLVPAQVHRPEGDKPMAPPPIPSQRPHAPGAVRPTPPKKSTAKRRTPADLDPV